MAKKKKMMFMGVDITESAECFDWHLTPSNKMNAAVSVLAENPDIEILQRLRAELIAHPKKYKDVCPCVPHLSDNPAADMAGQIDRIIAAIENPELNYIIA